MKFSAAGGAANVLWWTTFLLRLYYPVFQTTSIYNDRISAVFCTWHGGRIHKLIKFSQTD